MRDHGFCGGFCRCESEWKKTFEKEADRIFALCISFRSAQSELEATTLTDTAKVKLFTAENESSCKTAVSLDTHLVVIASLGHRHSEYFIQDVDGDVFDLDCEPSLFPAGNGRFLGLAVWRNAGGGVGREQK